MEASSPHEMWLLMQIEFNEFNVWAILSMHVSLVQSNALIQVTYVYLFFVTLFYDQKCANSTYCMIYDRSFPKTQTISISISIYRAAVDVHASGLLFTADESRKKRFSNFIKSSSFCCSHSLSVQIATLDEITKLDAYIGRYYSLSFPFEYLDVAILWL